jgi:hypothetical protein
MFGHPRRDQLVAGLDGHQPAKPMTEHKDRPDPQCATRGEQNDAMPASGIPVESQDPFRSVGWALLAVSGCSISRTRQRNRLVRQAGNQ